MSFHKIKEYTKQGENSYLLNYYGSLKEGEIVSKGARRSKGYLIIPKQKREEKGKEKIGVGDVGKGIWKDSSFQTEQHKQEPSLIPVYYHLSKVICTLILRSSRCFLKFPCFFICLYYVIASCHFNRIMKGNTFWHLFQRNNVNKLMGRTSSQ